MRTNLPGNPLLFGAIGGFVGATAGWICIGLLTPGDFFGSGSLAMLGLVPLGGVIGAVAAARVRSRAARIAWTFAGGLALAFWVGAPAGWWASKAPRELDPVPIESRLAVPLPAGTAEARFEANTGGDIMGAPAPQSGLWVVVRFADRELRQTIASCDEVTRGNALGDVGGAIIDIAGCDYLYRLVHAPGEIRVEREAENGGPPVITTRIELPPEVRTVVQDLDPPALP